MPTPAYIGLNPAKILSPHFTNATVATRGKPFVNVSGNESNVIGLRKPSEFALKPVGPKDATERGLLQGYDVTGKIPMLQTDLATFHNMYLYSVGPQQWLIAFPDGTFWSFVDDTAGMPTPNGSTLLSLLPTFMLDAKERSIELDLSGFIYPEEYGWLNDNNASAATGGSGGTALGITAMAYDRTKYKRGNITKITVAGVNVGYIKDDIKFELKAGGNKLNPGTTPAEFFDLKLSVMLRQVDKATANAVNYFADTDATVILYTAAGEQIKIHNPGQLGEVHRDEKESGIKLDVAGRWYRNADEAAPNSMDIGVTDPLVMEFLSMW